MFLVSISFWSLIAFTLYEDKTGILFILGLDIAGLTGGGLLLADSIVGGVLVLVTGVSALITYSAFMWPILSLFPSFTRSMYIGFWVLPSIMLLIGGVVGIVTRSDSYTTSFTSAAHLTMPSVTPGPPCPYCNNAMRFIYQYDRYYCDRCRKYS
ncbi:MAG: hypothetical protein ACTSRC_19460 [Candidatus Helarchaeota archaeon]